MNILLTGAVLPAAIGLARMFGAAGHRVVLAGCDWWVTGRASRHVARYCQYPSPRHDYEAFVIALDDLVARENIDLIIPCFEEVFYLTRAADQLDLRARLFGDDFATLATLHDKYAFIERVRDLGMSHPTSHRVSDRATLLDLLKDSGEGQRWVLKPVHSRFSENVFLDPSAADVAGLEVSENRPWVVQRLIVGRPVCTYSVVQRGVLTGHAAYTSLLTRGAGAAVACESIEHPAARAWVAEFVARTRFHGQISFDFIEDADGVPHVIECNPRATSGVFFLSYVPGAIDAFLRVGRADTVPVQAPGGVKIINRLVGALMYLEHRSDRAERSRIRAIDRQCRDYYYSHRDPLPFLWRFIAAAGIVRGARQKGMDIETFTTHQTLYDGD